jgi:hypothetical protein
MQKGSEKEVGEKSERDYIIENNNNNKNRW